MSSGRQIPFHPAPIFGLYALSDVLAAIVCHPLFVLLRRPGRHFEPLRLLGRRILSLAMFGIPAPRRALPRSRASRWSED